MVVDEDVASLRELLELLRDAGYRAAGAADFDAALHLVRAMSFELLIVDLQLKAKDGLRLIRLAREEQPAIAVVALAALPDPAIESEVDRLGATFSLKPFDPQRLLPIVAEKVSGPGRQRRWIRRRVAGGFRAQIGSVPAKVLDMSYGGLRLEMSMPPEREPPPSIEVDLMSFGLSVSVDVVWTSRLEPSGAWTCGAVLLDTDPTTSRAWRGVVDTLPKRS